MSIQKALGNKRRYHTKEFESAATKMVLEGFVGAYILFFENGTKIANLVSHNHKGMTDEPSKKKRREFFRLNKK